MCPEKGRCLFEVSARAMGNGALAVSEEPMVRVDWAQGPQPFSASCKGHNVSIEGSLAGSEAMPMRVGKVAQFPLDSTNKFYSDGQELVHM